ncbi:MAG: glycoside hydrolase family 127 protein, partial [Oscillospiraceae bacterium]
MLRKFKINDKFWGGYQRLICDSVIPYQREALWDRIPGVEKSHAIHNFLVAAGKETGEFGGWIFQDSDLAKWIEAVSYSLYIQPDKNLEAEVDKVVEYVADSQGEDGYLNTYFTLVRPENRWENLQEGHELYCAGHMIEAAVAYYEATGKSRLLEIMKKNADCIYSVFGKDKRRGFPGHPEVELALVKLYRATNDPKYLELSQYFIDERGTEPNFFAAERIKRDWTVWGADPLDRGYTENSKPVREQEVAEGHAVRAVYLYSGMADVARETGDTTLKSACERLWKNITEKQMYITGGIGSTVEGEAFTVDYDLPNDTAYAESCAAIGLMFFARRMLLLDKNGDYGDVMERALYNCVLAGMSLDGTKFFYVNPLEVNPDYSGKINGHKHVLPERPGWYGCA